MNILFVLPGPIYDPESSIADRLRLLSSFSEGIVVATSNADAIHRYGNYILILVGDDNRFGTLLKLRQLLLIMSILTRKSLRYKFDMVVSYDPLRTGIIALLVKWLTGCKLVTEVNGVYQSVSLYPQPLILRHRVDRWLKGCIARFILKRSDGVKLLFDNQLAGLYRGRVGQRITSFWDYVDLSTFHPAEGCKQVLFIGHPYYLKGVDILLAAFDNVSVDFTDWELKILGFFPGDEFDEIAKACTANDKIKFHPPVQRGEIAGHIQLCKIFVLPSRTEAMGRVLLESMACAKARIGSNVDGIPTVITDQVDGLLIEAGSVESLELALRRLMADEDLINHLGQAALSRVHSDFTAHEYIKRTEAFYSEVLN